MDEATDRLNFPRSAVGAVIAFGLIGGVLLAVGDKDYPDLHTILDTGKCLLSGALALLLWDIGGRTSRPFPKWIALTFAVTALLELVHVLVVVNWSGPLAPIAQAAEFLRPGTWPPSAYVLPIGVLGAIWLMRRGANRTAWYLLALAILCTALFVVFSRLPGYAPPEWFGITRPALIFVPLLWAIVGSASWRLRATDPVLRQIAPMAAVLFLAHAAMLYSRAPHD